MEPLEIEDRQVRAIKVIRLKGRIALGEACVALNEKLQALIGEGHIHILLDCSETEAIDSQGISALVRGVVTASKRGGRVKMLRPSPRVRKVLEITRLSTIIELFDDEGMALASFTSSPPAQVRFSAG
jgi:anti-sigma B factor antagonist